MHRFHLGIGRSLRQKCNPCKFALRPFSDVLKKGDPASPTKIDLSATFWRFPLCREVQLALVSTGVTAPTYMQELTIPKLIEGNSLLLIGQTGAGKTLAYTAPLIHRLLVSDTEKVFPQSKKPRCLILVPTRELCDQVQSTMRRFPVTSTQLAAGHSYSKEREKMYAGVDVVIATPWRLLLHMKNRSVELSQVESVVVDEADMLCDTFYEKEVQEIFTALKARASGRSPPQIVLVSATRTGAVQNFVKQHLPNTLLPTVGADAHMMVPQLEQVFIPVRGRNKASILNDVLSEQTVVGQKTLVFTNSIEHCKQAHEELRDLGFNAAILHGQLPFGVRQSVFRKFNGAGASDILVTTNIASRGLDFKDIQHVIMYDFPYTIADYIHRVGRTARAGRAGRVTALTSSRHLPMVKQVQEASRAGNPIQFRDATLKLNKVIKAAKLANHVAIHKYKKKHPRWRKLLGFPAKGTGTQETRRIIKDIERRVKAVKKMTELHDRGRLPRHLGLPPPINMNIERTDSQSVAVLKQREDGHMQIQAKRRKKIRDGPHRAPDQEYRDFKKAKFEARKAKMKNTNDNRTYM